MRGAEIARRALNGTAAALKRVSAPCASICCAGDMLLLRLVEGGVGYLGCAGLMPQLTHADCGCRNRGSCKQRFGMLDPTSEDRLLSRFYTVKSHSAPAPAHCNTAIVSPCVRPAQEEWAAARATLASGRRRPALQELTFDQDGHVLE